MRSGSGSIKNFLAFVLLCLVFFSCDTAAHAVVVDDALAASVRRLGIQTEMPSAVPKLDETEIPQPPFEISEDIATVILYAVFFIFILIILSLVPQNMWSMSRSRSISGEGEDKAARSLRTARMEHAGFRADDLAERGDFIGAMRVLLYQGVSELSDRTATPISASLTSREIFDRLGRAKLSESGAEALADMIRRVEISFYGTYKPGLDDYDGCKHSFEALKESFSDFAVQAKGSSS